MLDANTAISAPLMLGDASEVTEISSLISGAPEAIISIEIEGTPVARLLCFINGEWIQAQQPRLLPSFIEQHHVTNLSRDLSISKEAEHLASMLEQNSTTESDRPEKPIKPLAARQPEKHHSLFSLAKSVYQTRTQSQSDPRGTPTKISSHPENQPLPTVLSPTQSHKNPVRAFPAQQAQAETAPRQEKSEQQERRGGGQGGQQHHGEDQGKQKRQRHQTAVNVTTGKERKTNSQDDSALSQEEPLESMGNIFVRFMNLMARILGQAESEAHDLYQRIKNRTDQVDLLTSVLQKVNASTGEWDISNDPQALQLLERARELGVEIQEGKTKWTEEEKRLLKENIQMRKDSMEKMTQLERTDMQRFLQEASQCHQARSNVLKLLKEVMDTFIYNLRP